MIHFEAFYESITEENKNTAGDLSDGEIKRAILAHGKRIKMFFLTLSGNAYPLIILTSCGSGPCLSGAANK